MDLRDATLEALAEIEGSGPYIGVTLVQIAERVGQGSAARTLVDPFPQLGRLSRVIDGLVEDGLVEDRYEERMGFEGLDATRIRTYRIAERYPSPSDR